MPAKVKPHKDVSSVTLVGFFYCSGVIVEKTTDNIKKPDYYHIFFTALPPVLGGSLAYYRDADTLGYITLILGSYLVVPFFIAVAGAFIYPVFAVWFEAYKEGGKIGVVAALLASAIGIWYGINEDFSTLGIIAIGLAGPLIGMIAGGTLAAFLYALPFIAVFLFIGYAADNPVPFFAIVFVTSLAISLILKLKDSWGLTEIGHSLAMAFISAVIATVAVQVLNGIGQSMSKGNSADYDVQCSRYGCR